MNASSSALFETDVRGGTWFSSISTWSTHCSIIAFLLVEVLDLLQCILSEDSPDLPRAAKGLHRCL